MSYLLDGTVSNSADNRQLPAEMQELKAISTLDNVLMRQILIPGADVQIATPIADTPARRGHP